MADDDPHVHQAHDGDVDGSLDNIDVVILYPVLGVPGVVTQGVDQYLEVLIATSADAHFSAGNIAQYLRYRSFAADVPMVAQGTVVDAEKVFYTEQPWSLSDFKDGTVQENAQHKGADGVTAATLSKPIFPVSTCRIHTIVYNQIKDKYPKVFRVLFDISAFDVGAMLELVWVSEHNEQDFAQELVSQAGILRGDKLDSIEYSHLHMRHPFIVRALPATKLAHFTDIHNSTAHLFYSLAGCSVLENSPNQTTPFPDRYVFPIGSRLNNYNRNFNRLCDNAKGMGADAFVLTGDIVDYTRGLYFRDPQQQALIDRVETAGDDDIGGIIEDARYLVSSKEIWDTLGGNDQLQYTYDANFKYFIEKKILPRYVNDGLPVFTSLGNHDFHPNPFTPWPTTSGKEDNNSPNSTTPSDYNLTRYEAILAYGPETYNPYFSDTVKYYLLGGEGPAALQSREETCAVYFYFVNPFLDYSIRFGNNSMMLFDFGREETRPSSYMTPLFLAGLALALVGAALLVGAYFCTKGSGWGWTVVAALLALIGLAAIILGAIVMAAALRGGFGDTNYEELGDLPAAKNALNGAQKQLLDNWCGLELGSRAFFCHALVLGRAPKNVSIKQLREDVPDDKLIKVENLRYGVLTSGVDKILDAMKQDKITVTMSGHSHYSSVYQLSDDGKTVDAEFPFDGDVTHSGTGETLAVRAHSDPSQPRRKLVCVSPAAGPIAELNLMQSDSLSNDGLNSARLNRQLRDNPGGTLLELSDSGALLQRIVSDLRYSKPRRAAFDSWKNRFNQMIGEVNNGTSDTANMSFKYLNDIFHQPHPPTFDPPQPPPLWPNSVDAITFFDGDGTQHRCPFTFEPDVNGGPPVDWASDNGDFTAYSFDVALANDYFQRLYSLCQSQQRVTCAIDYPDAGEDPWMFEITTTQVTVGSDRPQMKIALTEFPKFDRRVSDFHYDQRKPRST